ncbi:uncharacterized protein ARMOST_07065 [Armillaria ostoyae]|uniref:Velvet domain-containing protein n=1 Tax=Armillaria ostoyae TaxID=47428 RepID=A0A284R4T0_ARMOS|nr:uncharacterized protein ARMOST_07065 [Armillaria ostoyae]
MLDLFTPSCLLPLHSLYDFPLSDERHDSKHVAFQCGRSSSPDFPLVRSGYGRQRHRKIRFRLNAVVYYKNKRSFSRTYALRLKVKGIASRQFSHSPVMHIRKIYLSPLPLRPGADLPQNILLLISFEGSHGFKSRPCCPNPILGITYQLEVVQQPQKTAEFRNASLSRLPLTPPLVARLVVRDPSGNPVIPQAELPFLIAHLSLYTDNGLTRMDVGYTMGQGPPLLYGNLVSSLDILEDLQGNTGLFFIFPDASAFHLSAT